MLSIINACDTHYSFKYTLIGPDSIVISYLVIPTSGCAYILKTQAPTDPSFTHKDQEDLKDTYSYQIQLQSVAKKTTTTKQLKNEKKLDFFGFFKFSRKSHLEPKIGFMKHAKQYQCM